MNGCEVEGCVALAVLALHGSVFEKGLDAKLTPSRSGFVQRRAAFLILRVRVRASVQKDAQADFGRAQALARARAGHVQRRAAACVAAIDGGAVLYLRRQACPSGE